MKGRGKFETIFVQFSGNKKKSLFRGTMRGRWVNEEKTHRERAICV